MEKYNGSDEHKQNLLLAGKKGNQKIQELLLIRINEYNKNPNHCKNCDKVLLYHEKHKKFCNNSCSASFTNKGKIKSENTKIIISEKLKKYYIENKPSFNINHIKICKYCGNEYKSLNRKQKFCSKSCGSQNRIITEETKNKLRNKVTERIKNGTFSGWKTRSKIKRSYAEEYFETYFKNEKINGWEPELPVGKYFVDFAFIEKKIALEIDGKQHEYIERKIKDIEKDEFLIDNDWKIFRIKWYNPINEKNKTLLYNQIDLFKKMLL